MFAVGRRGAEVLLMRIKNIRGTGLVRLALLMIAGETVALSIGDKVAPPLLAVAVAETAPASDGLSLLQHFLQNTPAANLVFSQTVFGDDGEIQSSGAGRLWFERPAKFRLEYDSPEQLLLVSDGKLAWLYEPELQQAVVQTAQTAAAEAPLLRVLSDGLESLRADYALTSGLGGEWRWAVAEAINERQSVRLLRLAFTPSGELRRVEMTDAFGGVARLDIESFHPSVDGAKFTFIPPPGVDVARP